MSDEGRVVGGGGLEWNVMEAGFQVQHANPLCLPELSLVPPRIIELIIILGRPLVDWDNILTYSVGLPGLDTRDKEQWHNALWLLPWKKWANHAFDHQFVQVYIQPGFLLWV